jgi:S-adenosylmethionine uptake transporter
VTIAPITTGTVIMFTIPIFVLILGVFFLSERIIWQRWVVTIITFIGIIVTLNVHSQDFNLNILVFVASAMCFAVLDIFNKRIVIQESMISMLFYSAAIAALISLPFAHHSWMMPTMHELVLLFILGVGSNLVLFFILKAFTYTDATAVSPYRYLELLSSAIIAYIIFGEVPSTSTIYGTLIIVPSTFFIIYSEKKKFCPA